MGRSRSVVLPVLYAKRGLYETFHETVRKLGWKRKNEKVLLGLSGGRDSVTLLHLLLVSGFEVTAAHLNHQLREKESNGDETFVKNLCKKWNVPLKLERANVLKLAKKHRISIEDAARVARYRFLKSTASALKIKKVVVAHHQRDQAETVLLKIFFGSDRNQLRGMELQRALPSLNWPGQKVQSVKSSSIKLIRPLLLAPYSEILTYSKQNNIPFREDSSNRNPKHPRNWIRNELIPLIEKKLNRNVTKTLARLGQT